MNEIDQQGFWRNILPNQIILFFLRFFQSSTQIHKNLTTAETIYPINESTVFFVKTKVLSLNRIQYALLYR